MNHRGFPLFPALPLADNENIGKDIGSAGLDAMDYLYYLGNASLTLRVIEFLHANPYLPTRFVTVIHQINGWVIRVKMQDDFPPQQAGNFQAFLSELGVPYQAAVPLKMALWGLETGQSPVSVMQRYQVAVVSHGSPNRTEIEEFRKQFIQGLGYCPETLA